MSPKTTSSKYRISVLLDLAKASETILMNAVQLAKAIDGSVSVFHVKPALSLVNRESQLSAIRNIRDQEKNTRNTLQKLVDTVGQQEGIPISFGMTSGNVKSRIKNFLAEEKPDIVVLGKPRTRTKLIGDSVTDFVMSITNAHVLIMVEDHKLDTFKGLSLGVFGNKLLENDQRFINDLKRDNDKPIRVFQIRNQQAPLATSETVTQHKTIDYVFTEGANALDSLVKYVHRTHTQLLCIPKSNKRTFAFQTSPSKEVLRKSDVPILIMGA